MGNLNIKIGLASNILFALAIVLISAGAILDDNVVTFFTIRVGVFLSLLSVFYALFKYNEGDKTLKKIWEDKSNSSEKSFLKEIWLLQPILFGILAVIIFVPNNPLII
ncbi:hypothetical protein [Alishewanella sp. HH-ZS]|uniref:hypothetical protein n=1 Tax=Alishewanella sp. HH-ZS TaxID=1856684 RepID=UPI00082369E7|nr:hypothetical protein [Alishewanella sp. HH-ZS]OCW98081.1 hypothetical protein A9165_03320 [Alishewanella sp. HH-ZS]